MEIKKSLVLLSPLFILVNYEILVLKPTWFYYLFFLNTLVCLFSLWMFSKKKFKDYLFYNFSILPILLLISSSAYISIVINDFVLQIILLFNFFFFYSYLKNAYYAFEDVLNFKQDYFKNSASYVSLLIFFFLSSSLYGFQSLLKIPIWILLISWLPLIALLIFNIFWVNSIDKRIFFIYILISCLVLGELIWAISFMPLTYNILGFIATIFYYIFIDIIKFYLTKTINKRVIKLHLALGFSSLILILLTAKWM